MPARPVTTTVTISTPGSTRIFVTKLDNNDQANSNFVKLAKVVVGRTNSNRLKYKIIPLIESVE